MDRPSPSLSSATGASLVGTLLAVGLLLIMVTVGVSLVTSTEARDDSVAELQAEPLEALDACPADVLGEAEVPAERTCLSLTVRNAGDAIGLARCELSDQPTGAVARFVANGVHVYTSEIGPGDTEELLIRVDGAGSDADEIDGTCNLVAPPLD